MLDARPFLLFFVSVLGVLLWSYHRVDQSTVQVGAAGDGYESCTALSYLSSKPGTWRAAHQVAPITDWHDRTLKWYENDHTCPYRHFTVAQIGECLRNRTVLFSGDSLVREQFKQIERLLVPNITGTPFVGYDAYLPLPRFNATIVFLWTPSVFSQQVFGELEAPNTLASFGVRHVTDILVGVGVWDIGTYNRGVEAYYTALVESLQRTRAAAAERGATLVFQLLHWLVPAAVEQWRDCNAPHRQQLWRHAQHVAARCVGVATLDGWQLTRAIDDAARGDDAVHLPDPGWGYRAVLEKYLSALCVGHLRAPPTRSARRQAPCPARVVYQEHEKDISESCESDVGERSWELAKRSEAGSIRYRSRRVLL